MWNRMALAQTGRLVVIDLLLWSAVAIIFAAQGHVVSAYRGAPQPWWPSFGYSLAIFSVWALLSPPISLAVHRAELRLARGWRFAAFCAVGLPVAAALHVASFALLYWPIYNSDGAIPSRWAMTERMVLANFDTNVLFYALIVGATLAWTARNRRAVPNAPPAGASTATTDDLLRLPIRSKGLVRLISAAEIDWINAADDYAEIHADGVVHLIEKSLAALERELPAAEFARIHRSSLVRLDRVVEVRSLGRGDAIIRLAEGTELRLSRRYRTNLSAVLRSKVSGGPADPGGGSRLPIGDGSNA
jgi:hypothetical protein